MLASVKGAAVECASERGRHTRGSWPRLIGGQTAFETAASHTSKRAAGPDQSCDGIVTKN